MDDINTNGSIPSQQIGNTPQINTSSSNLTQNIPDSFNDGYSKKGSKLLIGIIVILVIALIASLVYSRRDKDNYSSEKEEQSNVNTLNEDTSKENKASFDSDNINNGTKLEEESEDEQEQKEQKESTSSTTVTKNESTSETTSSLITRTSSLCSFSFNYLPTAFNKFDDIDTRNPFLADSPKGARILLGGGKNSEDVQKEVVVSCLGPLDSGTISKGRDGLLQTFKQIAQNYDSATVQEITKNKVIGGTTYTIVNLTFSSPALGSSTTERYYLAVENSYQYAIRVTPLENSDSILEEAGLKFLK